MTMFHWDRRTVADRKRIYDLHLGGRRATRLLQRDPARSIHQWAATRRMTVHEAYEAALQHFGKAADVHVLNPPSRSRPVRIVASVHSYRDVDAPGATFEEALLHAGVPPDPDNPFPLMRGLP